MSHERGVSIHRVPVKFADLDIGMATVYSDGKIEMNLEGSGAERILDDLVQFLMTGLCQGISLGFVAGRKQEDEQT